MVQPDRVLGVAATGAGGATGESLMADGEIDPAYRRLSMALETAALREGVPVRRLGAALVLCGGEGPVAFQGLAGQRSGRVAHMLCANDVWLRRYLAARGLATAPGDLVEPDRPAHGYEVAERIGFPLLVRWPDQDPSSGLVVPDPATLRERWPDLAEDRGGKGRQLLLERVSVRSRHLAVVGERVESIATDAPHGSVLEAQASALARRAVASLPGLSYALVRLVVLAADEGQSPDGPTYVVDGVDPTFTRWASLPDDELNAVATAVLRLERASQPSP